jgi:hypothetical protein
MLLAVAQLPLLSEAHVRAQEVVDKHSTQVGPIIDLVARQVLEPRARRVVEVVRQAIDDEEVVGRGSPRATRWGRCPHCILAHWSEPGSVKGISRRGCSGQRPADLASLVTSCARGRRRYRGVVRAHGGRDGASGCRGCRCSQLVIVPRWCSERRGWDQDDF